MTDGVSATVLVTAFTAGVATFFAPCAFPLLLGYVGYYVGTVSPDRPVEGALARGLAGSVGILFVFGGVGLLGIAIGRRLVGRLVVAEPLVGTAVIALGLVLLSGRTPTVHVALPRRSTTVLGFALFGGAYALAAAGCFAPAFLFVVLQGTTVSPLTGVALTLAYAAGTSLLFLATTVAVAVGHDVSVRSLPVSPPTLRRLAGAVVVASGAVQLYRSVELLAQG